ncbi:MAG: hypothetical protein HC817_00525 [Saprospiraceae bacterium]|nr:hypothetical protein [Saprospiraceae bacterium]
MSEVVNLITYGNPPFKVNKAVNENSILPTLPPQAMEYLQIIPVSDAPIVTCCCLKDVGNTKNGGTIDGTFNTYRVSMMTLPKGLSYVDYHITDDAEKSATIQIDAINPPLNTLVQTLLILDINAPISPFHYCEGDDVISPMITCVDTLTSLRGSQFKPFHLFNMDIAITEVGFYPELTTKKPIKGQVYLVPFHISEGTTVYFVIADNDPIKILNRLVKEIKKTQTIIDGKHHWYITSAITYQDSYGIFICTEIKSINNVIIGG